MVCLVARTSAGGKRDEVSASISDLIAPLQPFAQALVNLAGRARVQPRVTSTLRTRSQQQRLYAAYLRGETHYPVAPPGSSAHEFGYAFDMVAATREDLHDLGQVWIQAGGLWTPDDEVHFQYPGFVAPALSPDSGGATGTWSLPAIAQWYNSLPWYVTALLPSWSGTETAPTKDELRSSPGGRLACRIGIKAFC